MKNLILVRHAKSSWRFLCRIKSCFNASRHCRCTFSFFSCKRFHTKTYSIWASTAKRATNTALIFAQNFGYPLESIVYKDDLYTFDENKLEKIIKSCSNLLDNVIVFGHNSAITNFVNKFGVFIDNVSTSGFVSLEFDTNDWTTIEKGKINKIIFPKELR
jgi:phosphohistidine phosphatase